MFSNTECLNFLLLETTVLNFYQSLKVWHFTDVKIHELIKNVQLLSEKNCGYLILWADKMITFCGYFISLILQKNAQMVKNNNLFWATSAMALWLFGVILNIEFCGLRNILLCIWKVLLSVNIIQQSSK